MSEEQIPQNEEDQDQPPPNKTDELESVTIIEGQVDLIERLLITEPPKEVYPDYQAERDMVISNAFRVIFHQQKALGGLQNKKRNVKN